MNGRRARKLRNIAKQLTKKHQTTYLDVNKHYKMVHQKLSKDEMKRRSESHSTPGGFDLSGFLSGGKMEGDVLVTPVEVSQRVMKDDCLRAKYQALKKHWSQISSSVPALSKV